MASEDKLISQVQNLTTDAAPIPQVEISNPPSETVVANEPSHESVDSDESNELEYSQEHNTALHDDNNRETENGKPLVTDEQTGTEELPVLKTHGKVESKIIKTSSSTGAVQKKKKSSDDRRIAKLRNAESEEGKLKPAGPSSVTYNISGATNVRVGPTVTVNLSGSQSKSPQMAAPKKTKEIAEILQSTVPVTEEDIDTVSPHVGHGWKKVGRLLEFSGGQLDQFEANYALEGRKEVIHQMLLDWKRTETDKATCGSLCSALWSAQQYDPIRILARKKSKCEN